MAPRHRPDDDDGRFVFLRRDPSLIARFLAFFNEARRRSRRAPRARPWRMECGRGESRRVLGARRSAHCAPYAMDIVYAYSRANTHSVGLSGAHTTKARGTAYLLCPPPSLPPRLCDSSRHLPELSRNAIRRLAFEDSIPRFVESMIFFEKPLHKGKHLKSIRPILYQSKKIV